jgi:hypothetical protein
MYHHSSLIFPPCQNYNFLFLLISAGLVPLFAGHLWWAVSTWQPTDWFWTTDIWGRR